MARRSLALPALSGLLLALSFPAAELPILAWTGFDRHGRSSLVEPVSCELRYYHFGGSMVRGRVLELMERLLDERLGKAAADTAEEDG